MKRLLAAATALSLLGAGAPALADDKGWKDREKDRREARKEWEKDRREAWKEYRKLQREAWKEQAKDEREFRKEQRRAWREGQHMHSRYYDRYIDDPRAYGLRQAPPGYRWVLVEDDAYMVRRDNGLISDIIWSVLGR